MRRLILVPLLIVLVVLAIAGGIGYYIYNNYLYYNTDDAQISGTIVPVSATANGELTTLNVKIGDKVSQGQTIGTITPAAVPAAPNASRQAVDITSPIDGVILQIPAAQGQNVVPGLPIAQVTNLDTVTVTAFVDENAINNIKLGQDVDIHVDAYSDTTFTGHVQQIVQATAGSFSLLPTQDNASGNFTKVSQRIPVIVTLDGTAGKAIVPGMSAEVTIHIH